METQQQEPDDFGHPWILLAAFLASFATAVFMIGTLIFTDLGAHEITRKGVTWMAASDIN